MADANRIIEQMKCPCCGKENTDPRLLALMLDLQLAYGKDLNISSGCRCKAHEEDLKKRGYSTAKKISQHSLGKAFDTLLDPKEIDSFILLAKRLGFTGIGRGSNFVHLDVRDLPENSPPVEWGYPKPRKPIPRPA